MPSVSPVDLPVPIPEDPLLSSRREVEDGRGLSRANISKWQPKQTQQWHAPTNVVILLET